MEYPVTLERDDNGTVLVSFPDFPEAHTFGDTTEEALERAADALATVIEAYLADRRPIPRPSERPGSPRVRVPARVAANLDVAIRGTALSAEELDALHDAGGDLEALHGHGAPAWP